MTEVRPKRRRDTLLACLELFRDLGFPQSFYLIVVFLYVAENEGLNFSELAHVSRLRIATAARLVRRLLSSEMGLLEVDASSDDKRLKFLSLSARGIAVRARLDALIAEPVTITDSGHPQSKASKIRNTPSTPQAITSERFRICK